MPDERMEDLTVILEHKSTKNLITGKNPISPLNDPSNYQISVPLFPGKYTLQYKVN